MSTACKTCDSQDFCIEGCERVCTTCGDVQDEYAGDDGELRMLPDREATIENFRNKKFEVSERLTSRIRAETNSTDVRRQINREKLLDEMRRVVKQLIKHSSAVDETMDLVSLTFQKYQGRLLTSKKFGLVGACIYYLSAKHQLGISLSDICKTLNIRMKVINVCLKKVRSLCPNFEYERQNIRDLVKKFIDELSSKQYDPAALDIYRLPGDRSVSELRPLFDRKDNKVLRDRVMLLIELFEAMHPYNQPTPQSLITAVVYHAWRSLDTFKLVALNLRSSIDGSGAQSTSETKSKDLSENRIDRKTIATKHSVSFEKFCQLCNLKYSSNGHKIVSKLQASLLMLGRYLGDVNKINLPWFLKDIIDNSPHLIQEHMRTEPEPSRDSPEKES